MKLGKGPVGNTLYRATVLRASLPERLLAGKLISALRGKGFWKTSPEDPSQSGGLRLSRIGVVLPIRGFSKEKKDMSSTSGGRDGELAISNFDAPKDVPKRGEAAVFPVPEGVQFRALGRAWMGSTRTRATGG